MNGDPLKRQWKNPAKESPKPETMNTPGDFRVFTDVMKKIVRKPKPSSPSPVAS
jgi:hypothetical protein